MEEEAYDEGHQVEPDHDEEDLASKEIDLEHQLEREYDNEKRSPTETETEHQMEPEDDSEQLSLKGTDTDHTEPEHDNEELSLKGTGTDQMEPEHDNEELSLKGTDTDQMEPEHDNDELSLKEADTDQMEDEENEEELLSREIDSDLNKSDSLPSLADSEEQPNTREGINDASDNHAAQNSHQHINPSLSIKKERHIADALPNDIDLLADYESETSSSHDATKLTWSAFQIAYLISAPVSVIGLALVVMGALNFPPTFNLLTIGIPIFIIGVMVFSGSTIFLCFYKAKKMRLFEFGDDVEGEVAGGVGNMSYVQDEETMVPNMSYNHDEQILPNLDYTSQDAEEHLPL